MSKRIVKQSFDCEKKEQYFNECNLLLCKVKNIIIYKYIYAW